MGQIKHYNNGKWAVFTVGEDLNNYTGGTPNTYHVGPNLGDGVYTKVNPDGEKINLEQVGITGYTDTNVYNSDGNLTGDRTVSQGSFDLDFTGDENSSFRTTYISGINPSDFSYLQVDYAGISMSHYDDSNDGHFLAGLYAGNSSIAVSRVSTGESAGISFNAFNSSLSYTNGSGTTITVSTDSGGVMINQGSGFGYYFPNVDGSNGQIMVTNGSGVLSWQTQTLDGLSDVDTYGVNAGDVLTFDGVDWGYSTPSSGGFNGWTAGTSGLTSIRANNGTTEATGDYAVAEGYGTLANGYASHAEGQNTTASGDLGSHAEGRYTTASGLYSHSEGVSTTASGEASHSEGDATNAIGYTSHAEGQGTIASNDSTHAEGRQTIASGYASHAEGEGSIASGRSSHTEGSGTTASGMWSHAGGLNAKATSDYTFVHGFGSQATNTGSTAFGQATLASGLNSFACGMNTLALGDFGSHSEGYYTTASGQYSHSEGVLTEATNNASHAEGSGSKSTAESSHAEGHGTTASSFASHSEGWATTASNQMAHAGGFRSVASGIHSFVHGSGSTASGNGTVVLGNLINGSVDNVVYVPTLSLVINREYLNDAAADADSTLPSGGLYTLTGGRTVYRKP